MNPVVKTPWLMILLSFFLVIEACGNDVQKKEKNDQVIEPENIPELFRFPPAKYELFDPDCQTSDLTLQLTKTEIPSWSSFAITSSEKNMKGIVSEDSLKSGLVNNTVYGKEYVRTCDYSTMAGRNCIQNSGEEEKWLIVNNAGGPLKICKDGFKYPRETYEEVGLSAIYYLNHANQRYVEVSDNTPPLKKITLNVLPNFKTVFKKYKDNQSNQQKNLIEYITHNAAYYPSQSGSNSTPMLVIFPETACLRDKVIGFLWESSFVLSHEFGHHIEQSIQSKMIDDGRIQEENALLFGESPDELFNQTDLMSITAKTKIDLLKIGVSEAFADLVGYYTDYGNAESLIGIDGFGYNRIVGLGAFKDNTPKILTEPMLKIMLQNSKKTDLSLQENEEKLLDQGSLDQNSGECSLPSENPNLSDIHTAGAILAHTVDEAFQGISELDKSITLGKSDFNQRYRFAIKWRELMFEKMPPASSDEITNQELLQPIADTMKDIFVDYLVNNQSKISKNDEIKAKNKFCSIIKIHLPLINNPPFSQNGTCG